MNAHQVHQIRAAIAASGLTPASWIPEASQGRSEEASFRPAKLVEGASVRTSPVGSAEPWPGPVAFLDGIQRYDIVAHAGTAPLVIATIAAAVRERIDRRLHTVAEVFRTLAVGRQEALDAAGAALDGLICIPLPDDGPVHPVRDLTAVRVAVDRERGRLELEVGAEYAIPRDGWLVVDGSLSDSPLWAASPQTIGIAKSHSILPFEGENLNAYLRLPCGHRSSVFARNSGRTSSFRPMSERPWSRPTFLSCSDAQRGMLRAAQRRVRRFTF